MIELSHNWHFFLPLVYSHMSLALQNPDSFSLVCIAVCAIKKIVFYYDGIWCPAYGTYFNAYIGFFCMLHRSDVLEDELYDWWSRL